MVTLPEIPNGVFDPASNLKYNYEYTKILGTANKDEVKWIREKTRYNPKIGVADAHDNFVA